MSEVLVTTAGGVCEIVLARPERKNALNAAMCSAITEALEVAGRDPSVRAVLLRGEGGNFTSGYDVGDFISAPPVDNDQSPVARFLYTLAAFAKPVVAAVEGVAVGVGTTLLLHCDLVYAAPATRFQLPFVNLALVPEAGSSLLLPRLAGHARAAELLFFGERFDAATAKELGLITAVVDDLHAHARARVQALVEKPAEALRLTKQLLKAPLADELRAQMNTEAVLFKERLASPELREAVSAFFEKRPAKIHMIRAEKVAARKEAVLEAALACFEELGYDNTSIEDIRARSGASIGSIYHHFGRKEVLAAALYADTLEHYRHGLRRKVAEARSARSLVRGIVQYHLDWAADHPGRARYLVQMRRSESVKEIEPELRASTAAFLREIKTQLDKWRDEVLKLPMGVFAAVVMGPAQEMLRQWVQRPDEIDLRAVRDLCADAAWRAVRA